MEMTEDHPIMYVVTYALTLTHTHMSIVTDSLYLYYCKSEQWTRRKKNLLILSQCTSSPEVFRCSIMGLECFIDLYILQDCFDLHRVHASAWVHVQVLLLRACHRWSKHECRYVSYTGTWKFFTIRNDARVKFLGRPSPTFAGRLMRLRYTRDTNNAERASRMRMSE